MGRNRQAIADLVLTHRQRNNSKASELTDRERATVDEATRFERINGEITIARRTTKEGNHDNCNPATA